VIISPAAFLFSRNLADRHPLASQFTNQFLRSDMNPTLRPKRRYRRPGIQVIHEQLVPVPVPVPIAGSGSPGHRLKRSGRWEMVPRTRYVHPPTTREQVSALMTNVMNNAFERMQQFLPLRHSH
jgi:hypothetical protein